MRFPDEPTLVVRARTDREAFGELYDLTHGMIYRYCRRRLSDRSEAEDACSAVFLAIAQSMPEFRGESLVDFRRWVFGVARNQTAATLRKTRRRSELLRGAVENGVVHAGETAETVDPRDDPSDEIGAALARLGQRDQTLIDLRYREAMSHKEIGQMLGMRAGSVRTAMSRALERLRQALTEPERTRP